MFKMPSKKALWELKQEKKKFARGWNSKNTHSRRPYDHMEHVDTNRICLSGTGWNPKPDPNNSLQRALKAGHSEFFYKNGETCVKIDGKFVEIKKLFPEE